MTKQNNEPRSSSGDVLDTWTCFEKWQCGSFEYLQRGIYQHPRQQFIQGELNAAGLPQRILASCFWKSHNLQEKVPSVSINEFNTSAVDVENKRCGRVFSTSSAKLSWNVCYQTVTSAQKQLQARAQRKFEIITVTTIKGGWSNTTSTGQMNRRRHEDVCRAPLTEPRATDSFNRDTNRFIFQARSTTPVTVQTVWGCRD